MSTPPSATLDAEFAFELVKLLLQVAWADGDLAPAEGEAAESEIAANSEPAAVSEGDQVADAPAAEAEKSAE